MKKQVTFWINEDVLEALKEYSKRTTESDKALSGTVNVILQEYLKKASKDTPIHSETAHTHTNKNGIDDILDWIEENNPSGITKDQIDKAIKNLKGMDQRTIRKYEPEVINNLLLKGYKAHPKNNKLYIRYDLSFNKTDTP